MPALSFRLTLTMTYLSSASVLIVSVVIFAVLFAVHGVTRVNGWRLLRNAALVFALVSLVCNLIAFAKHA